MIETKCAVFNRNTEWYAVYTAFRSEKKVYSGLVKRGFEAYLPVQTLLRQWSDRRKRVDFPVIEGYVFVQCSTEDFSNICAVPGVVTFLSDRSGIPLPLEASTVGALQKLIEKSEEPLVFSKECLMEGDRIEVIRGRFKGWFGELIRKKEECRLVVRLGHWGCVTANVAVNCVRKV